jgi:RNA polymerase sigma-70 factor (ECF subfamily)
MGRETMRLPIAFEELMRLHERAIMRFALRATGSPDDAADLFQETWLRAYRAYPRLEPDADALPWLYTIAANLCRNRKRDRARRSRVILAQNDGAAAPDGGERHGRMEENEGYAAVHLRQLISALPPKQRQALYLRYFAGLDYDQIGAAMRCSAQAARANVSQAARKLKAAR